jgi:hypothetical protein
VIDLTKILDKLVPEPDGEDVLRLRVGIVEAVTDGRVDVDLSGTVIEGVPVLGGATLAVGQPVQMLSYRGALLALGSSGASLFTPVSATTGDTANGTTTSGSFVTSLTTSGAHGVAFIAPPSGTVAVHVRSAAQSDTAGSYSLLDFQVRTGDIVNSGTVVRAASENTAGIIRSSTAALQATIVSGDIVSGLTPGADYNVTLAYHVGSGGTSTYNRRHVMVTAQ